MMKKTVFVTILVAVQIISSVALTIQTCKSDDEFNKKIKFLKHGIMPIILIESLKHNPLDNLDMKDSILNYFKDEKNVAVLLVVTANTCPETDLSLCGPRAARNYPLLFMAKSGRLVNKEAIKFSLPSIQTLYTQVVNYKINKNSGIKLLTIGKNAMKMKTYGNFRQVNPPKRPWQIIKNKGESSTTSQVPQVSNTTNIGTSGPIPNHTLTPWVVNPKDTLPTVQSVGMSKPLLGIPVSTLSSHPILGQTPYQSVIRNPVSTSSAHLVRTSTSPPVTSDDHQRIESPSLDLKLSLGSGKESEFHARYPQGGTQSTIQTNAYRPVATYPVRRDLQTLDLLSSIGQQVEDRRYDGGSNLTSFDYSYLDYLKPASKRSR